MWGGSSSSSPVSSTTLTEKFLDSAVLGLDYNCTSGRSGTTNASGEYTCTIGDRVSFSIAGISLGTTDANATITPLDLFPSNEEAGVNLAQLLQTLDADTNASNGIVFDSNLLSRLNGQNIDFTANDFESSVATLLGVPLVGDTVASLHLNITLAQLGRGVVSLPNTTDDSILTASAITADPSITNGTDLTISLTVTDTDGVSSVDYEVKNSSNTVVLSNSMSNNDNNYSATVPTSSLTDGNYTVTVTAIGIVNGENPNSEQNVSHNFEIFSDHTATSSLTLSSKSHDQVVLDYSGSDTDGDKEFTLTRDGTTLSTLGDDSVSSTYTDNTVSASTTYSYTLNFKGLNLETGLYEDVTKILSVTTDDEPFVADTDPDIFDFTNIADVNLSTAQTTNTVTITGINTSVTATTNTGTIVLNGSDTSTNSASVEQNDTVSINLTSSPDYNTTQTVTVTIGDGSDTFTVTTKANTPPTATDVTVDAQGEDITIHNLNAQIADNESDDNQLTITVVSNPTHGALIWNGNEFTYEVTESSAYSGDDSFTYKVTDPDNGVSETKTVTIIDIIDS